MSNGRWRALLLVVVAVLGVACGVPAQDRPERLGDQGAVALIDTPPTSQPGAMSLPVFFVRGERLVAVPRAVPEATLEATLRALFAGPSTEEAAAGLHSAVGPSIRLGEARVQGGLARVDLSSPFAQARSEDQVIAVAQLVFTATEVRGVEAVSITVDGEPIEIPTGDGGLTGGPLRRAHFPGLEPVA